MNYKKKYLKYKLKYLKLKKLSGGSITRRRNYGVCSRVRSGS